MILLWFKFWFTNHFGIPCFVPFFFVALKLLAYLKESSLLGIWLQWFSYDRASSDFFSLLHFMPHHCVLIFLFPCPKFSFCLSWFTKSIRKSLIRWNCCKSSRLLAALCLLACYIKLTHSCLCDLVGWYEVVHSILLMLVDLFMLEESVGWFCCVEFVTRNVQKQFWQQRKYCRNSCCNFLLP